MHRLHELARLFLKLGTIGFGGPAVHIAFMDEEVVKRRKWLSHQQFLDLMGATNLIPGPNSTEMAIHIGYQRAGLKGLVVAGFCFLVPAILITTVLAAAYVSFGHLPQAAPLLAGIRPVVLAIILAAVWRLGRKALRGTRLGLIALAVAAAPLIWPGNEVLALLVGSLLGSLMLAMTGWQDGPPSQAPRPDPPPAGPQASGLGLLSAAPLAGATATATLSASATLLAVFLFFLKVGAVLYGTGYVLVAYLEGELVHQLGWLTSDQLIDAIAIGQFTPGPILSTATFIGYLLMEGQGFGMQLAGAAVATVGIFLPSFLLVAVTGPIIPRLRSWKATALFLDSVNAASLGLMAAVVIKFSYPLLLVLDADQAAVGVAWVSLALLVAASIASLKYKVSPAWIVLAGALVGITGLATSA